MNRVCDDHAPVIITRQSERPVMMLLEDYSAIEETMYLLKSPANAQRLYKVLEKLKAKEYQKHSLIDNRRVKHGHHVFR